MQQRIEVIERVTVGSCAPSALEELEGWLLPFDPGPVNRAKSAVPLRHEAADPGVVPAILARYAARGQAPQFRLADVPSLAPVHAALAARAFVPARPTLLQLTAAEALARECADAAAAGCKLAQTAAAAWVDAFFAGVADPRAEEPRLASTLRAPDTLYAAVMAEDTALAIGAATVADGFACVHSMRTRPNQRGRGLARQLLIALAQAAHARGVLHILLQVECDNHPARALYRRCGFTPLWQYRYWSVTEATASQTNV